MRFRWLKDFQELEEQILYLQWNLNKSELELARWKGGDLSNVRLEKNSRASSLEEKISKIHIEIGLLNNEKNELLYLVDTFTGVDNQIVKLKYVENLSLEDIADEIGYSVSYVRKRFTEIKKTLSFLDEYEERRGEREKQKSEIDYYNRDHKQLSLF